MTLGNGELNELWFISKTLLSLGSLPNSPALMLRSKPSIGHKLCYEYFFSHTTYFSYVLEGCVFIQSLIQPVLSAWHYSKGWGVYLRNTLELQVSQSHGDNQRVHSYAKEDI